MMLSMPGCSKILPSSWSHAPGNANATAVTTAGLTTVNTGGGVGKAAARTTLPLLNSSLAQESKKASGNRIIDDRKRNGSSLSTLNSTHRPTEHLLIEQNDLGGTTNSSNNEDSPL